MKNAIATIALCFIAIFNLNAQGKSVELREGNVIRLRLLEDLSSKTAEVGDMVTLEVSEPVMCKGKVVIESGARATGVVVESSSAKMAGKKGKLNFTIDYAKAVDGTNVRLRSVSGGSGEGKSRTGGLIAAAYFISPAALLFKGKEAQIEKGQSFTCYIDEDVEIEVRD
jgi:hypothetical protein